MSLKYRSYQKELLDDDNISPQDLKKNLAELNFINTYLGGHKISIEGLKSFVGGVKQLTVCEIGCGGGDNIAALNTWCLQNKINATFIGVDIKPVCIEFAKEKYPLSNVTWVVKDYKKVDFQNKPDIVFSSLFAHHFNEEEIAEQLTWMRDNSTLGFFINDLQRSWVACKMIKILTTLLSKSYLVKHDAPLSVARALTKNDWINIFSVEQIHPYTIRWKWAFRYLIVYKHGQK